MRERRLRALAGFLCPEFGKETFSGGAGGEGVSSNGGAAPPPRSSGMSPSRTSDVAGGRQTERNILRLFSFISFKTSSSS